jgi:hypothetical protein
MENVILNREQMNKAMPLADDAPWHAKIRSTGDINIAKAQACHILKILKERYTRGIQDDSGRGWIMISPDEIAEIEKEIEG